MDQYSKIFELILFASAIILVGCSPKAITTVESRAPMSYTTPTPVITSNPLDQLIVDPITPVAINASAIVSAIGGAPPYRYHLASGLGTFNGNVFTAPSSAQTVTVNVIDSAGQQATVTISIFDPATVIGGGPGPNPTPSGQPVTLDVYSTPVCWGGYCSCGVNGTGTPNQASAAALCAGYGYSYLLGFNVVNGPTNQNQCDPQTGQCFNNQNAINVVCYTVTCQ